ncbi:uncharacterized [Tachysurus ichikawai]
MLSDMPAAKAAVMSSSTFFSHLKESPGFSLGKSSNTSAHHVNIAVSVFYKSADERQDAQTGEAQHRAVILQNAHLGPDGGEAGQCSVRGDLCCFPNQNLILVEVQQTLKPRPLERADSDSSDESDTF